MTTTATARLTRQTLRSIFGTAVDLTDETTRRSVWQVFQANAVATGRSAGARSFDVAGSIPLPPAQFVAAKIRALPES